MGAGSPRAIYDRNDLAAEVSATGNRIRMYAYWPGIDQPHSMRTWEGGQNGTTYYYALDLPTNNVEGLFGTTGSVAARYDYSPFGEAYTSTGTVTNPLRFASREMDAFTGLYYVRARWYDPYIGRFISEDPIGLAGGINNYAYALNDPVNLSDPTGLSPCLEPDHFRCGESVLLPSVSSSCLVFSPCWFEQQASTELPPANYPREPRQAEREERSFLERAAEVAKEIGECTLDHYGLGDLPARGASWLGAVPIDKRAHGLPVLPGASSRTNLLNRVGHNLLGPVKLPGTAGRWARTVLGSNSLVTLAGRANLFLAAGFAVYDGASIAMCVAND